MDTPHVYEIRVEGHLTDRWSDWFEGMVICKHPNLETTITGLVSDQAALFGVLIQIHNLNLVLVSVIRLPLAGDLRDMDRSVGRNNVVSTIVTLNIDSDGC
jgi:hypothetical protein